MKAFVTGATGFIGSHLVELLHGKGYKVICLVRRTSSQRWIQHLELQKVEGDLDNVEALRAGMQGCELVFHISGLLKANRPKDYLHVNYYGTRNVLQAACSVGSLRRFVYLSSLAAVGPTPTAQPVDENTPCQPISWYGKSKLMGELEVIKMSSHLPVTIIRPPIVYGPRDTGIYNIFRIAAVGLCLSIGGPIQLSLIYIDDLLEGILKAVQSDRAIGQVYFMTQEPPIRSDRLMQHMLGILKPRTKIHLRIPLWVGSALMDFSQSLCDLSGRTTYFNRDKAKEIKPRRWTCSSQKARHQLGFQTSVTLEDGLRNTVMWYKKEGWL